MLIPDLQKFPKLFAQMEILQQKLIKIWSRDTLMCENVLGKWTPTPPGVEFWRTKIRFYYAGHRKTATTTKVTICRAITLWCKSEDSKKSKNSSWTVWQMDISQHKLIKICSRDTLVCENVLGSGSPTPPGVEFWRTKIRFYPAGHRKKSAATKVPICRAITL